MWRIFEKKQFVVWSFSLWHQNFWLFLELQEISILVHN
jgi:hypothetical protein